MLKTGVHINAWNHTPNSAARCQGPPKLIAPSLAFELPSLPRLIRYLRPLPNDERYTQQRLRALQRGRTIDEATVAQARLAGTFRACRLRDLVSSDWFAGETY